RRDRAVEAGDRLQAGVAIAAGLAALLAEIIEQHLAAATRGLAEADQRVELAPLDLLLLLGQLRGFRHAAPPRHVGQAVEHPGLGRQAVAPGPAGLRGIGLEALRQVAME